MRIALGADPFGLSLKDAIRTHLAQRGHECLDLGGSADHERPYYEVAADAGRRVAKGEAERAILVCGSGMGMAIVANKVKGVYAAVCENPSAAAGARVVNNANVLALGANVTAPPRALEIVDAFLRTEFKQGEFGKRFGEFLERSMQDIAAIEEQAGRG